MKTLVIGKSNQFLNEIYLSGLIRTKTILLEIDYPLVLTQNAFAKLVLVKTGIGKVV
jgi:hypothetical protein